MEKKNKLKFKEIAVFILFILLNIGSIIWALFYSDAWYTKLEAIFGIFAFTIFGSISWRFFLGKYALLYNLELIPHFFKERKGRSSFDITKYYYLGRYYFDKEEYKIAKKHFDRAIEAYFYKIAILKIESNSEESKSAAEQFGIENDIDNFYKNNTTFIAFLKSSMLYLSKAYTFFTVGVDGITLAKDPIIYYIKTRKILSTKYDFLHDFDEDEKYFTESKKDLFEDNNLTKEQMAAQRLNNVFKGSVDLRCIEAKLMLECNEYAYYEKALEISNEIVDIVEKSTNQTILWRLLYVRGCAYHKLGDADLACKDWKKGIELGDLEFSQKMYNENCKES
ncbi:hypothetical protein Fleli_1017 [Bernardetia litoralis DSM 6794]|uniref:Tetratricopeptide repeat protein n=1 Tax=Bernardetia litoralis (strain ATCC 23117 / DSM 6794 / NBRC 15988 / NCIMB 1366 / Fx l1 / Sio-4) TaxID=880071 RepID=I4AHM9_BERLS|nr:hypothetical protein [Bernardetia litoralis]AFM03464.1 hypothetical protein Fleli_1017 [Bernardetia litoralis DSM 6794]